MKETFWHKLGFHDWYYKSTVKIIEPLRGPFDPREEIDRIYKRDEYICCFCGKIKTEDQV
jgi:hypothetical protein